MNHKVNNLLILIPFIALMAIGITMVHQLAFILQMKIMETHFTLHQDRCYLFQLD